MTIEDRVKEALMSLQGELDWIQQAEKKLGSEQPQDESVQPLQRQQKEHSVSIFFSSSLQDLKMLKLWCKLYCCASVNASLSQQLCSL